MTLWINHREVCSLCLKISTCAHGRTGMSQNRAMPPNIKWKYNLFWRKWCWLKCCFLKDHTSVILTGPYKTSHYLHYQLSSAQLPNFWWLDVQCMLKYCSLQYTVHSLFRLKILLWRGQKWIWLTMTTVLLFMQENKHEEVNSNNSQLLYVNYIQYVQITYNVLKTNTAIMWK